MAMLTGTVFLGNCVLMVKVMMRLIMVKSKVRVGDLAECNESSKKEIRVGVIQWRILKETQWYVHRKVEFTVCETISKSKGHAFL